jgi:hypothetical protein
MARIKLFVLLMLAAIGAGAAFAQDHGAPAHSQARPFAPDDARILSEFAKCAALRKPLQARALLDMDSRAPDYQRALIHLTQISGDCGLAVNMRFNADLFAGGLAEGLLQARFQPGDLATHVALDATRPPIPSRDEAELMNLCVVRAAPGEVAALLRTEPSSTAETVAFRSIVPHLAPCLRGGVSVNVDRLMLRASLALAAYRLSDYNGFALAATR